MKDIVKNKVKDTFQRNKYNILLTLIIFILFIICGYSNTVGNYTIFVNSEQVELTHGIYTQDNEQYIHIDDLINVFKDNVYNDKISGKLIITTYDKLIKISKSDDEYVIKKNNESYVDLKKVINQIGSNIVVSGDKIYIFDAEYVEGTVKNNRVELYDKIDGKILCFLTKQDKVKIYIDEKLKDNTQTIVDVEATIAEKTYYGYALKKNFEYEFENLAIQNNTEKIILVKADSELSSSTDIKNVDIVAINMYRLSGVNTLTKLEYTNNVPATVGVLATINNGQKSSNYDLDIVTRMLNSESNRYQIIQQILDGVKNIIGVNLDFSNFKVSDKQYYTQFVKELAAVMHSNNKIVVVNVANTQYIDVQEVAKVADYIVLQPYSERTISSKTSGPISSISYVEQSIKSILTNELEENKVILEIPAYTILWTERRGTVINAEQYNMKAMKAYLKENNIASNLDNSSGQNYINYIKGITTYKMWLEDEYSVIKKAEFVNKYNLAGVSIYKSGMELTEIYDNISKCLLK